MRGSDDRSGSLFSYVDLEKRIRPDHPLRTMRRLVDDALASLDRTFADLYAAFGRPSIPPERLLRAMLLQAFYSIRSERLLMERLDYDLLFRWFVGLGIDDPVWDPSTFSKNRDRLLEGDIAARFLTAILALPRVKRLLSHEHFSVDGTLIEAWASMKSFKPKDSPNPDEKDPPQGRNPEVNFRGERRSNETHVSTTDPGARLYRKGDGMEAKLCFMGHALMENRNGFILDACVTQADGHAERIAALAMIEPWADRPNRITLGAGKAFDTQDFVNELRTMNVTPHVAQKSLQPLHLRFDGAVSADPSAHRLLRPVRPARLDAVLLGKVSVAVFRKSGLSQKTVGRRIAAQRPRRQCSLIIPHELSRVMLTTTHARVSRLNQ